MSNTTALRTQYPYAPDALSPRPQYGFPSPTSNYPSGIDAPSPSFFPMAYQISPRFGTSAFIPPPDVFVDGRRETVRENGVYTPRNSGKRAFDTLNTDPVAMHLLVETAMGDSQNFDILTVEEVDALKQEQKMLDTRLSTVRRKLESETKIRDATRSLGRLASSKANAHKRGIGSKGSNAVQDYDAKEQEGLESSNKKVEEFIRECLEIESRMRMIDMQLLMHTAAVLQFTHKGPKQRDEAAQRTDDRFGRPDSPASLDTYDEARLNGAAAAFFDERSLYRTPENLDNLMDVLQNGKHHQPERANQSFSSVATRLQEMNERLRNVIIETNPERDNDYSLPPLALEGTVDASTIDRQLDFLDKGIRSISAEQVNIRSSTRHTLSEVEGRLEGINNQLYGVLSRSADEQAGRIVPPPAITGSGSTEQLNYMEDSFYNLEQIQYAMNEKISNLRSAAPMGEDAEKAEKYESTIKGLWDMIRKGEDEALERKRERRRLLAEDPDNQEQLSPDEDNSSETYSLLAFTSKIQMLFRRATGLKEKQSVLLRQIKQQRELNSKSDAQKEAEFERLNTQILSARSEKRSMEDELDRALRELQQFDGLKSGVDPDALRETQERNAGLEAQLINVQERVIAFETELKEARQRAIAYENQLKDVQEQAVNYHSKLQEAEKRAATYEEELKDHQERNTAYNVSSQEAQQRTAGYEAQVRDAQERALMLEGKLREAQEQARVGETIKTELAEATKKIAQITATLEAVTEEKQTAEARSLDATNNLNAKEEEFRSLESEIVRLTTELTFAKAELDGAYGTRAQRAADSAANPAIKKELDELSVQNQALRGEIEALRKVQDVASQSEAEARQSERNLKAELSGMAAEYEALTRDAIQNEKDRDALESQIDKLRDEKEALERELSDEKVKWLGVRSPGMPNGGAAQFDMGATSIRMLREDFRKMMRDRTAEGLKALRVCYST